MTDSNRASGSEVIPVSDAKHPLAFFRIFFTNRNNIYITVGVALITMYFVFAFLAVKSSLYSTGRVVLHNRTLAKEYRNARQNNSVILRKIDSLDKNKYDKILLDSIEQLNDSAKFYKAESKELAEEYGTIRQQYINVQEENTIINEELQHKGIRIQQLKAQQEYNNNFYKSLSRINDSLISENHKLKLELRALKGQLSATVNQ